MPFKLFEFLERFINGAFLITLKQTLRKLDQQLKFFFRWKTKN